MELHAPAHSLLVNSNTELERLGLGKAIYLEIVAVTELLLLIRLY